MLGAGHDVTVTLVQGDASEGLLETAKGADLLVVGNRGRGAIKEALLGSTSGRVADHAPCPVVIVRALPGRVAPRRCQASAPLCRLRPRWQATWRRRRPSNREPTARDARSRSRLR